MVKEAEYEAKKKKFVEKIGISKETEEIQEFRQETSELIETNKHCRFERVEKDTESEPIKFSRDQPAQGSSEIAEMANYQEGSLVDSTAYYEDFTDSIGPIDQGTSSLSERLVKHEKITIENENNSEPVQNLAFTEIVTNEVVQQSPTSSTPLADPLNLSDDSAENPTYTRSSSSSASDAESLNEPGTEVEDSKTIELTRWKKANPDTWKHNVAKRRRSQGLDYEKKKKKRPAKVSRTVNCQKCRFKCQESFSEEDKKTFCSEYWKLDYIRQKDFILSNCTLKSPERRRAKSNESIPRSNSKQYHFQKNKTKIRICQSFFLKTLISNYVVLNAFKSRGPSGNFVGEDKRGKSSPPNKTKPEVIDDVKRHIECFPTMESHYSRRDTERLYLDRKLSISKMHELYLQECERERKPKVSLITYKRIFGVNYNLSFFKPRKDQCQICEANKPCTAETSKNKEAYVKHLKRRDDCYEAKRLDKERASRENNFVFSTFDLQSVLQIPSSDVSPMYYSRNLCVYNLTIYESVEDAYCFCWTELNGKRGSSKIGTCLFKYLNQLAPHVDEVVFWSDTCGGQNRNQHVAALLLYAVQETHIEVIEHKFLESGHSYMEADSMHSSIEKAKKYVSVFAMNDWLNIFRAARSKRKSIKAKPYEVEELKYNDFLDLKELSKSLIKNRSKDTNGEVVNWLLIKSLKYSKKEPGIIQYKYEHSASYCSINVVDKGRPISNQQPFSPKLYKKMLPIGIQKKNDLLKLCHNRVIPDEFHGWYKSLPVSKTAKDVVPEPAAEDSDEEEDFST
ncbi:unnamed protein product [Ceutorhynchus assimilis]|uniref:DUF7869 domain-containing protein n=1 Tax=Ceutorhynchus assimilis TaxID=467358 RepID=A0A9N9QT05_9CUCU|nr:unnamed protein product [Ceutorhynchus assimilis]